MIHFTSDVWTSDNNLNAFLSLTGHWVDKEWNRKFAFLKLHSLDSPHTGLMISNNLETILQEWNIDEDRRGVLVRDNGASMVLAARLSGLQDLGCYIHTIQLVVHAGLKPTAHKVINDTITTARSIVGHFRHSTKATECLQKIQASLNSESSPFPQHRLIQDIRTRWNSTFYMLERLQEQKAAIGIYTQDHDLSILTSNQWMIITKLVETLRPFEQETRKASLSTATAGIIIPSIRMLSNFLETIDDNLGINAIRRVMLKSLNDRYADVEKDKTCVIATALDPNAKLHFFCNETKEQAKDWLLDACLSELVMNRQSNTESNTNVDDASTSSESAQPNIQYDFWKKIITTQEICINQNAYVSDRFQCLQEINMYLAEPAKPLPFPPALPDDPICYWKVCCHLYPNLSTLARRYLGTPPSSVDSERAFSAAGNICTDKRSSLSADKLEKLLFLQKNLTLLNFEY